MPDGPKHRVKISQNLVSRNPEYADPALAHPPISCGIPRRPLPVDLTIDLNHQARCSTEKIGNVGADRMLATELQPIQPTAAKP